MGEADVQRDLGGLEADMKTVKAQLTSMAEKIDKLVICMAMARGGYRTLIAVGAVAGATGGFIVKVLPFIGIMR